VVEQILAMHKALGSAPAQHRHKRKKENVKLLMAKDFQACSMGMEFMPPYACLPLLMYYKCQDLAAYNKKCYFIVSVEFEPGLAGCTVQGLSWNCQVRLWYPLKARLGQNHFPAPSLHCVKH
jgi:hypothetical protein